MTQKHFAAVAAAINAELLAAIGNHEPHGERAIRTLALTVADNLAAIAPAFNRPQFLAACVRDA